MPCVSEISLRSRDGAVIVITPFMSDLSRPTGHPIVAATPHPARSFADRLDPLIGIALAVGGVLCFSARPVLIKLAYGYGADPVTLLAFRMTVALPFFAVIAVWQGRRQLQLPLSRRDAIAVALLGFIGYYLSSFLDFLGLQYISAGLGRLVLFLYPTVVLALSALFLGKTPRPRELIAFAVCYAGLALVLLNEPGHSVNLPLGAGLVFAGGVTYAIYLVTGSDVLRRVGSIRFSAYTTSIACVFCIGQFFVLRPLSALDQPWPVYGIAALIGTLCTVVPVFMTTEALKRIGANRVGIIGALGPVSTIVLGYLGLDEAMNGIQVAGVVIVLAGVLLVTDRGSGSRRRR